MRWRLTAAITACTLVCAGCAGAHHRTSSSPPRRSALAEAEATHEYPSPPPPRQTATTAAPTAVQAIRRFTTAYINWNAQTVAHDMLTLARECVGQARSAMQLAAAGTAGDYELQRGGIANHGAVEAVALLPGHGNQYVVVTLESTTATNTNAYEGLLPAWHVAVAGVAQLSGGWVVNSWQPES
jgi:hypothetical protein